MLSHVPSFILLQVIYWLSLENARNDDEVKSDSSSQSLLRSSALFRGSSCNFVMSLLKSGLLVTSSVGDKFILRFVMKSAFRLVASAIAVIRSVLRYS